MRRKSRPSAQKDPKWEERSKHPGRASGLSHSRSSSNVSVKEDEIKEEFIEIDEIQNNHEPAGTVKRWYCIEVEGFKNKRIISFADLEW